MKPFRRRRRRRRSTPGRHRGLQWISKRYQLSVENQMNLTHTLSPGPCATGLPPQRMLDDVPGPLTLQPMEQSAFTDQPETLSTAKEVDEDETFSGRELAAMFVILLIATATVAVCTLLVINRDHTSNVAAGDRDEEDDLPHFSEFDGVTASIFSEPTKVGPAKKKLPLKICETKDCQYTRWLINISVNRSMNPCDNFHRYVCSGVTAKYPHWFVDDQGHRFMMGYTMTRNNTALVYRYLNTVSVPESRMHAHQKAAAFFRECPVIGSTAADVQYLKNFIREHQLWSAGEPSFNPLNLQVKFMIKTYLPFLFTLDVPFDQRRGKPLITLGVSKEFTSWLQSRSKERKEKTYRDTVETVLSRLEVITLKRPNKELVKKVMKHENKAVKLHEREFPDGDLVEEFPLAAFGLYRSHEKFGEEWVASLELYSVGTLPRDSIVAIKLKDIRFFHDLFDHPGPTKREELKTFIAWSVTRFMAHLISLYEPAPYDACFRHTFQFFRNAVAYPLYATVNKVRIDMMRRITDSILQATAKSMNQTEWMDESTRKEAVRKVQTVKTFLAYPPGVSTLQGLDGYYSNIPDIKGPFLKDYMNAAGAYATQNVFKMTAPTRAEFENTTFILDTMLANAAYARYGNALYVTAGLMMAPAFSIGGPPELNYGAIGRVVAHELMHGFTPDGRHFNADGREDDWWTTRSAMEYSMRVRCHNKSVERSPAARRSLLENEYLSDVMGEGSVYRAYKRASRETEMTLSGVGGLTSDQLFYVAGCLLYCGQEPGGDHPPIYHRCNVPFINSPQFAKAFSCPENSPMNPREKCQFW